MSRPHIQCLLRLKRRHPAGNGKPTTNESEEQGGGEERGFVRRDGGDEGGKGRYKARAASAV